MSNKQIYKQCKLGRDTEEGGKLSHVAWIPSQFAKINKILTIKDSDTEEWSDGWVVLEVWGSRDVDEINFQRDAQKRWESVIK